MTALAALADAAPAAKDVVLAEAGAAAALAGLVLVFLGVLVTSFQSLLGRASTTTLDRYRRATWTTLAVFALALAALVLSTAWLLRGGGHGLYVATVVVFFVGLASLAALAVYATARVLLR